MKSIKSLLGFLIGVVGIIVMLWSVPTGAFLGAVQGISVLTATSSALTAAFTFMWVGVASFIVLVLVGGILNFIGNSLVD